MCTVQQQILFICVLKKYVFYMTLYFFFFLNRLLDIAHVGEAGWICVTTNVNNNGRVLCLSLRTVFSTTVPSLLFLKVPRYTRFYTPVEQLCSVNYQNSKPPSKPMHLQHSRYILASC